MRTNVFCKFIFCKFDRFSLICKNMILVINNGNWTEWSAIWVKSYAWFQNWTSAQCEFNLKSQVWFQTKIAQHEVQLPLYYIHFEIAQIQDLVSSNILLIQYWAGLKLNSSIFWEEKIRVLETKVAKFATWSFMSFIFLQFDWLLKTSLEVWLVVLFLV